MEPNYVLKPYKKSFVTYTTILTSFKLAVLVVGVMIAGPIILFFLEELRKYFARRNVTWLNV